jgi:large subunit ribosomal protein L9
MEVILREHVDNVGRRGEIVKVADGYARNYLLPRKLALRVTPGNLRHIERARAQFETREATERQGAEAVGAKLTGFEITIARKVGETGALYGSVTAADIVERLSAQEFDVDKRKVHLHEPIKHLGEYDVPIKLHPEVVVPVKVKVIAEGAPEKAPDKAEGTED